MKSSSSARIWACGAGVLAVGSLIWVACGPSAPPPAPPSGPATAATAPPPAAQLQSDPSLLLGEEQETKPVELTLPVLAFEEFSTGLPSSGTWRGYPLLHDFNMDGRADLVASNREEDGFNAWEAPKTGAWIRHIEGLPRDMAYGPARAADMNGDGQDDLVLSAHSDALRLYLNDGQMNWTRSTSAIENPNLVLDLAIGDLNGDGLLDVVTIGHFEGGIGVYLGDGKGGLKRVPESHTIMPTKTFGKVIELADLDGDKIADIVVATNVGMKVLLTRQGDPLHWEDASVGLPAPQIGNSITAVRIGRFVDGGWPQVAACLLVDPQLVGDQRNGIGVYAWNPANKEWAHIDTGLPRDHTYRDLRLGDFDRDGKLDILTMSENTGGAIYRGDGHGGFQVKGRLAGVHGKCSAAVGDIDGDGLLDVVISTGGTKESPQSGGLRALLNRTAAWN